MANDPFKNFKPLNSSTSHSGNLKRQAINTGDSFVEQIRSIGSSITQSVKTDLVKGTAKSIYDQLLNSSQTGTPPSEDNSTDIKSWFAKREQTIREETAEKTRQEERTHFAKIRSQEKVLFNFADERLQQEIKEVRQELALLVKSIGKVEKQIETAVIQEIVNPGLYHKNFFENLKAWLVTMRKSMEDASLWLSTTSTRKSKGYFWQQTSKSGTKFSMSHERQSAMSVG